MRSLLRTKRLVTLGLLLMLATPCMVAAQGDTVNVSIEDFLFFPDSITIEVGTTIRWRNDGSIVHNTTSNTGVWGSPTLSSGETFFFTFMSIGEYPYRCTIHPAMTGNVTVEAATDAEDDVESKLPGTFVVSQNYPNPFNPATSIPYSLPSASRVTVEVFNVLGQRVATLLDEYQSAGDHTIEWQGTDDAGNALPSGIYFYRVATEEQSLTRKMALLK